LSASAVEIGAHALHRARSDRFHPRLLDRVIDRPGRRIGWRSRRVHPQIMVAQPQRIGIGKATGKRDLFGRQVTAGHRHFDRLPRHMRRVGGEAHLHLRIARHRSRRA
jgi:hypothetical protein